MPDASRRCGSGNCGRGRAARNMRALADEDRPLREAFSNRKRVIAAQAPVEKDVSLRHSALSAGASRRKLDGTAVSRFQQVSSHRWKTAMEQQHSFETRTSIGSVDPQSTGSLILRGWIYRLRVLASTTFVILRDST